MRTRFIRVMVLTITMIAVTIGPALARSAWEVEVGDKHLLDPIGGSTIVVGILPGGRGLFRSDGDKIWVIDWSGDGERVGVHWYTATRHGICINPYGASGGPFDLPIWAICDKKFPAHIKITMRIGTCDKDRHPCRAVYKGSGWHNWSAYEPGNTGSAN
jgi:hypothetical protein